MTITEPRVLPEGEVHPLDLDGAPRRLWLTVWAIRATSALGVLSLALCAGLLLVTPNLAWDDAVIFLSLGAYVGGRFWLGSLERRAWGYIPRRRQTSEYGRQVSLRFRMAVNTAHGVLFAGLIVWLAPVVTPKDSPQLQRVVVGVLAGAVAADLIWDAVRALLVAIGHWWNPLSDERGRARQCGASLLLSLPGAVTRVLSVWLLAARFGLHVPGGMSSTAFYWAEAVGAAVAFRMWAVGPYSPLSWWGRERRRQRRAGETTEA